MVFGGAAAADARMAIGATPATSEADTARAPEPVRHGRLSDDSPPEPRHRLRESMWDLVGIVRCATGPSALDDIDPSKEPDERPASRNLLEAGRLIAIAAPARRDPRQPRPLGLSDQRQSLRRHLRSGWRRRSVAGAGAGVLAARRPRVR